jgi:hypothetical protein
MKRLGQLLPFLILSGLFFWGLWYLKQTGVQLADEQYHFDQIVRFYHGDWSLNPNITTIPGYELVLAGLLKITGEPSLTIVRLVSVVVNLFCWLIFYRIARLFDRHNAYFKTLQFALLPIALPFFILVYTDIFALLLILISLWFLLARRYWLAGLIVSLSLMVRQNEIIWVVGFWLMMLVQEVDWRKIWPRNPQVRNFPKTIAILLHPRDSVSWFALFRQSTLFIFGAILFSLFLYLNGGVALAQKEFHPTTFWHFGNVYYGLFILAVLFWPLIISSLWRLTRHFKAKTFLGLVTGVIVFFCCYQLTFVSDHFHNGPLFNNYLRNRILLAATAGFLIRTYFFIPVFMALLFILRAKMIRPVGYLVFPLTLVILLASWFIDPRYYFVPLTLFILFREKEKTGWEIVTLVWWGILGLWVFLQTIQGVFVV